MYSKLRSILFIVIVYVVWLFDYSRTQTLGPSDQPEAYFNGSSYIRLQTTISLKRHTSFSFRSCIGGELFTQKHNENTIELSVNAESVKFVVHTGGRYFETKLVGNYLDNKWHVIQLEYRLGNLTLAIDNQRQLFANATYQSEVLTNRNLYNDGAILIVGNHFIGCILEGPSIIFNRSFIHPHNVIFGVCPIPINSCSPKEDMKTSRAIDFCINEPCMGQGICHSGLNSYTCTCSPRFSGKNCEIDLGNFCDKKPPVCKNGATCIEINGNYRCNCAPGYIGTNCDQEVIISPLCTPNPCLNNGMCVVNTAISRAQCNCLPGFTGALCEININECQSAPCLNNGKCKDGNDTYVCDCGSTGYTGKNCEININECRSNPCQNFGTCYDTYGGFTCLCPLGFDGKMCQFNVDECVSQPCLNGGQCIHKIGGYDCLCQSGFAGKVCELEVYENPCLPPNCSTDTVCINNPCLNGGTCNPLNNSYNCTCSQGYTGNFCHITNECVSAPCKNGGLCFSNANGFYCNCTGNWTGLICDKPLQVCKSDSCLNGGTCTLSSNKKNFVCLCPKGFDGRRCETNIDDCVGVVCPTGQHCVDLIGDYKCRCPTGYVGHNCSLLYNPCVDLQPCLNEGVCVYNKKSNNYSCTCLPGYTGKS